MDERPSGAEDTFEGAAAAHTLKVANDEAERLARAERLRVRLEREAAAPDLDAAGILAADDRIIKRVYIAPWGGNVYIRTMSGTERDTFEASLIVGEINTRENVRAKLLVHALCDKSGNKLFTLEQVNALGEKSAAGLTLAYNEASALNAVSNEDVDDLAKNSGSGATVTS